MPTIFDKIIAREIPADIVYEDDETIAFLDIKPGNKGHTLVVPKVHSRNVFDITPESFAKMTEVARKLAKAIKEATGANGVNIIMNNEEAAGQEVFHTHIHVIPRFTDDHIFAHMHHTSYADGEAGSIAKKIANAMS